MKDEIEYVTYEQEVLPDAENIQDSFQYGKGIEKLDANISIRNIPEPVDPKMEYAICPASSTCVEAFSSHVIPLNFGTSVTNDSNMLTTANKITITTAGVYICSASIVFKNIVTSGDWRGIDIRKNGTKIAKDEINPRSGFTYTNAHCLVSCNIGDTIDVVGIVSASACVDIDATAGNSFLHIARVS